MVFLSFFFKRPLLGHISFLSTSTWSTLQREFNSTGVHSLPSGHTCLTMLLQIHTTLSSLGMWILHQIKTVSRLLPFAGILKWKYDELSGVQSVRQGLLLSISILWRSIDFEELCSQNVSINSFRRFLVNAPSQYWTVYQKGVKNCISQRKAEWCHLCQPTWKDAWLMIILPMSTVG